jgi:hypothetical protein
MRKSALLALLLVILGGASACAPAGEAQPALSARTEGRECFYASQVSDYDSVDRDTVYVTTSPRRVFALDILDNCPDINWSRQIVLQRRGGSNFICRGQDADLLVPSIGGGLDRCPVFGIRQLSPDEVQAWRASRNKR